MASSVPGILLGRCCLHLGFQQRPPTRPKPGVSFKRMKRFHNFTLLLVHAGYFLQLARCRFGLCWESSGHQNVGVTLPAWSALSWEISIWSFKLKNELTRSNLVSDYSIVICCICSPQIIFVSFLNKCLTWAMMAEKNFLRVWCLGLVCFCY